MGTDLIEEEGDLGPSMKALTPKMRGFVRALRVVGAGKWMAAAKMAGYEGDQTVLAVTGHRLSQNPKITAALVEIGGYTMMSMVPEAIAAIQNVMEMPAQPEGALKLKAATTVLDRCGLGLKTEHTVNVNTKSESKTQLIVDIRAQIEKNPAFASLVDPRLMKLINYQPVKPEEIVDVEVHEIVLEAVPDPDNDLLLGTDPDPDSDILGG
jgi:hypothetical protein